MCVENHVQNVYVNHVENQVENCVEAQKKTNQFNFLVEIYANLLILYIFQVMRSKKLCLETIQNIRENSFVLQYSNILENSRVVHKGVIPEYGMC